MEALPPRTKLRLSQMRVPESTPKAQIETLKDKKLFWKFQLQYSSSER
jgi:hypothetical protein